MPSLNAVGIVSRDLAASIRFYRLLGVTFPEPDGDHVEAVLPNGLRLMLDTLKLIKELDKEWTEPTGHQMGLAFECASPADSSAIGRSSSSEAARTSKGSMR